MRLAELILLAYGKFTDEKLSFPKATHDFHVIIGPNEAGKSTVRRAITELIFGMEVRSPLGFKHAQSDLRLAGLLESGSAAFPFVRSKQQKSLRSMAGDALPESFLAPVLGGLMQETFEDLHCLDHARMLRGGQGIVDPKNTVSQILFQAASGLEDFAAVREALGERAGALFARTGKSNQFAKSSEKFAQAQRTLKDVQVRAKAWTEARDSLQAAVDALDRERERRRELGLRITQWERARRLAPLVETLARLHLEIQQLGDVTPFAPGAKETLVAGIERMNAAAAMVRTREEDLLRAQGDLDAIQTDEAVLAEAAAITHLGALCGLHPNHARDLPVRRAEVDSWLAEVYRRSAPFNWGRTEAEVRARLPGDKLVRSINALLKARGALFAEERAAQEAVGERRAAVSGIEERLMSTAAQAAPPQLVQALELALPFSASEARQKNLAGAAALAQAAARHAMAALGRPELTEEAVRSLQLPSQERVAAYRAERQEIVTALALARSLAEQSSTAVARLDLSRSQFERSHQVVTVAEVAQARRHRDGHWNGIKAGEVSLAEGIPRLDTAMRLADELADSRTRSEADAAEVQALRDQVERAAAELGRHEAEAAQRTRELAGFDARWADSAAAMGLAGMALDDLPAWLTKREAALQAAAGAAAKEHESSTEREGAAHAKRELEAAMAGVGLAIAGAGGLAALCVQVDEYIQGINVSRTRHFDLRQQLQGAEGALRVAANALDARVRAAAEWSARWVEALKLANLQEAGSDVAEVESAISTAEFIRQSLERVDATRAERIDTMEADLARMREAAQALRRTFPALGESAPEQAHAVLSARLEEARRQADRKSQARKYLDEAKRQRDSARSELLVAQRGLDPILEAAGVDAPLAAVPLVERWNARNDRLAEIETVRKSLQEGSDGLPLPEIQAEVSSHPAAEAATEVSRLRDALGDSEARLTALVAAKLNAEQQLGAIDGGDKAAVAEAQRQEALADMAEVSEEYLQSATAASLLKWAVDRYRDRKQGPLLERASVVFGSLTGGYYQKLRVDFDQSPPALVAYRQNQQVKVAGLSDGTRDQLFLALRIAALELQSEQGAPVPFIADDLFINFDDRRSQAGLMALHELSTRTQVIFLSHQEHLLPVIERLLPHINLIGLHAEAVS